MQISKATFIIIPGASKVNSRAVIVSFSTLDYLKKSTFESIFESGSVQDRTRLHA